MNNYNGKPHNQKENKNKAKYKNNENQLMNQINPPKDININTKLQLSIIAKPPKDFRDLSYSKYQLE